MTHLSTILNCTLTVLSAWLLADFFAGVVHWAQDKFLNEPTKYAFLNSIRADNDLHHDWPAAMAQLTLWQNLNTSAPPAWAAAAVLWAWSAPAVVWLAMVFAGFGNAVHRFAHMPKGKVPAMIRGLQWAGLFISADHHRGHHFDADGLMLPKKWASQRYCPMTNWLNPALDRIRFWKFAEWLARWIGE